MLPAGNGTVPQFTGWRVRSIGQVVDGRIVNGNHAGTRTGLDGHVAHCHATLHRQTLHGRPGKFERTTGATRGTDLADDGQYHILGRHARCQLAVDANLKILRFFHDQALCRQHMLNIRGANTKRKRTKGAMGRGM